jgi:hypothetical protein
MLGLYRKTNASLCVLLSHAWSHITGIPGPSSETDSSSLSPYQWKVPLLLRDLVAQLLQFWLALPPATQIGQQSKLIIKINKVNLRICRALNPAFKG